jgi:hypothetical protein
LRDLRCVNHHCTKLTPLPCVSGPRFDVHCNIPTLRISYRSETFAADTAAFGGRRICNHFWSVAFPRTWQGWRIDRMESLIRWRSSWSRSCSRCSKQWREWGCDKRKCGGSAPSCCDCRWCSGGLWHSHGERLHFRTWCCWPRTFFTTLARGRGIIHGVWHARCNYRRHRFFAAGTGFRLEHVCSLGRPAYPPDCYSIVCRHGGSGCGGLVPLSPRCKASSACSSSNPCGCKRFH